MQDAVTASISFFALGANVLSTVLLLLLNPRNREVRWFAAFQLAVIGWLLSQAFIHLGAGYDNIWGYLNLVSVAALPGLFLASALVEKPDRPMWQPYAAVLAAIPSALIMYAMIKTGALGWVILLNVWHVVGWGGGTYIMARRGIAQRTSRGGHWSLDRLMLLALLLIAPVWVLVGVLTGADKLFLRSMPLVTVGIQVLIFVGVIRMRFYNIDVRTARTGEVAARAAESERLAVLGELAATIAHEVRNPLTGMRSLTQRIATEDIDPEKRRRYAEVILEEVGRLERIVGNLLSTARRSSRQEWDGTTTELQPLFEDVGLLVDSRARAADVDFTIKPTDLAVCASRETVAQALLNLLLNAVQHASGSAVELAAARRGEGVDITVSDNGPGIPESTRAQIFEPFYTTGNGTGLGLSVVRSLARELNWEVSVEARTGGGTQFRIHVPDRALVTA